MREKMKGERDGRGNDNLLLLSTASIEEDEQHALHHWPALDRCGELANGRNAESFYCTGIWQDQGC
jgi:hypothetical protein